MTDEIVATYRSNATNAAEPAFPPTDYERRAYAR
jgi:hypothetical protein